MIQKTAVCLAACMVLAGCAGSRGKQSKGTQKAETGKAGGEDLITFASDDELIDFMDNYLILDTKHKHEVDGSVDAWHKAIRKPDYCLLVLYVHHGEEGPLEGKEKSIKDLSHWFDDSKESVKQDLKKLNKSSDDILKILEVLETCEIEADGSMF